MTRRSVFIGQQPNSAEDEGNPLPIRPGSTGQRLVQMMGITAEAFERNFIRMNVSAHHEPDGFSPEYYRVTVQNILPLLEHRRVILLGPAVASSFGLERKDYDWACWFDHPTHNIALSVIPHPSGLNRLYNEHDIWTMVCSFLDQVWQLKDT